MKIEVVEIQDGDNVMIKMDIGNIPSKDVDAYVKPHLPKLRETFGCPIAVLPVRNEGWDFTIIRNPHRRPKSKLKKVA